MTSFTPVSKDRVRGFFLGTAIGDSLGCPVEGWSHKDIKEKYGRLECYVSANLHKWHKTLPAGSWTDDTQLTLAVAEGLIAANGFDMDRQVETHIAAYKKSTSGWGGSTRTALENLISGIHWRESGVYTEGEKPRGFGNGVAMKAGPIGVYLAIKDFDSSIVSKMADFAAMTHKTSMAVSSGVAHVFAVYGCLTTSKEGFSKKLWLETVIDASELGKKHFPETLKDDLTDKLRQVRKSYDTQEIIDNFGGGSYYVYHSLPFTYAFFMKDPTNIETLYECVSAGGDTDSNASMLGGLMGALCGTEIFPKHLVEGLSRKDEIIQLADKLSEKFMC